MHKQFLQHGGVISQGIKRGLIKWLILASFSKRYTGRLESDLYEDMKALEQAKGLEGLLKNLSELQ